MFLEIYLKIFYQLLKKTVLFSKRTSNRFFISDYRTSRCQYPTSVNKVLFTSLDKLAVFDAFMHLEAVSPRAVCFIVGERAETQYFSRNAYDKALAPKEFHVINGASHIDLYDKPEYTSQVSEKLNNFFDKYLK